MAKRGTGRPRVIDTNVPKVANGGQPQASPGCEEACILALREVTKSGILVLDEEGLIFKEYMNQLSLRGQPGMGDQFMKWVHDNQHTEGRCTRVHLDPAERSQNQFREFPTALALQTFDPSDRKFVAVALAHGGNPPVQVAVDSGWWIHRAPLKQAGVCIDFLCPIDIKRAARRRRKGS